VSRILLLGLLYLPRAAQAQTPHADLQCTFTGTDFVYDCVVRLTRGGKPLEGARISVRADMPAMHMAHQVRPQKAHPGTKPGEYAVRLDLEMLGEWEVELRLAGSARGKLVLHYEFDSRGATPVRK
jgi:hypothetical protein